MSSKVISDLHLHKMKTIVIECIDFRMIKSCYLFFCFLVIINVPGKLKAQEVLTLQDAIGLALMNNYDIQLALADSALLALDYSYRNAVFLPAVNADVGAIWTNNDQLQEFSDGTQRKGDVVTNNLNGSVNLNWVLFDGLRMFALRDKAEAYMQLGQRTYKNQVVNTVAQVINTYYLIVRQKQVLRAIEEQIAISQTQVELTQRKLEIGMGTRPDFLQSQLDLNAQLSAKLHQETYIILLKENLNQLLYPVPEGSANPYSTNYEVSDSIPIQTDLTIEDIQQDLEVSNPELLITQKNIDIAHYTLKEFQAERWPVVQFNSAYYYSRTNNDIALNPALPQYNRTNGFNYGFSASIPLLNYRNTDRLVEQAKLNIAYQQLLYDSQRSAINRTIINTYRNFELQLEALKLEEQNILIARENVDIILETYRLGSSTLIQLREAQKSLEDAYDRLIAARYNAKVSETELLRMKGELVRGER